MLTKEHMEFFKKSTVVAILAASLYCNYILVKYKFEQDEKTINDQKEVLKDYRNNYILSKDVDERSQKLNQ